MLPLSKSRREGLLSDRPLPFFPPARFTGFISSRELTLIRPKHNVMVVFAMEKRGVASLYAINLPISNVCVCVGERFKGMCMEREI